MWTIGSFTDPETGRVSWQVRLADQPDQIVAGGFVNRDQAIGHVGELLVDALVAAPGDAPQGRRFRATFEEGEETRDGGGYSRVIDPGATNFDRATPLPLMATVETSWGHEGARLAGAITSATRDGSSTVVLEGRWDVSEHAVEVARMVDDGMLTRHSPDLGADTTEFDCTEYDEEWGWCEAGVLHFTDATLLGTTVLPFPALDGAVIENLDQADEATPAADEAMAAAGVDQVLIVGAGGAGGVGRVRFGLAGGGGALVAAPSIDRVDPPFPASWFEDPQLTEPTPLTVTADGRVFGHIALWGTCHIGMDECVTPPRSASGYAYAHTRPSVDLDNGTSLRVGSITVGTGHAPLRGVNPDQAAGHYDDTGFNAALARFGEDEHGIWGAGVVDPNATDEQVWALQVSATSGDWRRIGGHLELVAVLAVNVPGFPIPDTVAASAAGECVALVAAGARGMARLARERQRVAPPAGLEELVARMVDARMVEVRAELHRTPEVAEAATRRRLAAVDAVRAAYGPTPAQVRNRRANMSRDRTARVTS